MSFSSSLLPSVRSGPISALLAPREGGLSLYLKEIQKFPLLSMEEETALVQRFMHEGDDHAAHTLVTSHLRLVVKVAAGFRGYGLPMIDMIAQGNLGLMTAVHRFDPEKGARLSTYALWWIRAAIQEFILESWSIVKIPPSGGQKRLFFGLRRLKEKILKAREEGRISGTLEQEEVALLAKQLNISERLLKEMEERLEGTDNSLQEPLFDDSMGTLQDTLPDLRPTPEEETAEHQERVLFQAAMKEAWPKLPIREAHVLEARRLQVPPRTLEELSQELQISRERVRQIENQAFMRLKKVFLDILSRRSIETRALSS